MDNGFFCAVLRKCEPSLVKVLQLPIKQHPAIMIVLVLE